MGIKKMKRLLDIFNKKGLIKAFVLLGFIFCCLFVIPSVSFAEDNTDTTSTETKTNIKEPDYYKKSTVERSPNRQGKMTEWVSVFNPDSYTKQDTEYLVQLTLDENVTQEDIAYLLKRYPSTLGSFDGIQAVQEDRIIDKLNDLKDDKKITEEQYTNAYRKNSLAFDELYKQSMRQTIAVGKENVDDFDPAKFTKDPAYHAAYNRAIRDQKNGIFTEKETQDRTQDFIDDGLAKKEVVATLDNGTCNIQSMREQYQSSCYSCIVIKTLMETFLNACSKAYDVTSEAGVKLLVWGALIWMAFFVMKNVSSLSSIEPGAMMNTLAVFLFKVMVAYILITSGLGVLIKYTVNPLLTAGADMGIAFTDAVSNISGAEKAIENREETPKVKAPTVTVNNTSTEVVPSEVLNRVMLLAERLDKNVSTNLVIGHAVTCWSMKGGAWTFLKVRIINLWLWICGALIWFVGFMLTLGIGYYLLDISFKLGFSIMVLPVAIGLWPFNITKGTVTKVISIMLKAAGTFVFLGLTTSYALAMISVALRDANVLFDNVEKGNAQWISETFAITGPYFLIILFAFLYSMKLISSTVSDYVNKFFADSVFGDADPMHKKLTQATDFVKQHTVGAAAGAVKKTDGKISNEVGEKAIEGAVRAGKFVRGLFKGKANGDVKSTNRVRSGGGGNNPMSNAGKAAKAAGATTEQTGKGVQAAGKGMEAAGKGVSAGGKGLMSGGKALSATGVGAIVGVPMMIAGAATYAAGKGAEVAGKVTQKAGQAMQKGGKAMKKAGEKMEKAGAKMEKLGNKLKFGDEKAPQPESEGKPDKHTEKPTEQEEKPKKENQTDDKKAAGGKNEK